MTPAQLLVAHAVKLMILVGLLCMVARRRHRDCWSFTAYLVTVLVGNCMTTLWPERFFNHDFYVARQGLFDLLKLLVGVEIACRVFAVFPGARRVARRVVFAVLALTTVAFALIPRYVPYATWFEWQPRIVAGTVWLFTGTALLVVWYRLPIRQWHRAILLGFTPYLLVFVSLLGVLRAHGWDLRPLLGMFDALAYLALVTWWAWEAWRPQEKLEASPAVLRRLGLEFR